MQRRTIQHLFLATLTATVSVCAGCHTGSDKASATEAVADSAEGQGAGRSPNESGHLEECDGEVHLVLMEDTSGRRGLSKTQYIDQAFLESISQTYKVRYGIDARVRRPIPLQLAEFDPKRGQYQDARILDRLEKTFPQEIADPNALVLAVMNRDIYPKTIPQWRYAFSMRREQQGLALLSSFRMTSHNSKRGHAVFRHRMQVMLAKNVGRMLCEFDFRDDPSSVMYNRVLGPADLDQMSDDLRTGR